MEKNKKLLIIGLGNPILGDDGIGWKVGEEIRNRLMTLEGGKTIALKGEGGDHWQHSIPSSSADGICLESYQSDDTDQPQRILPITDIDVECIAEGGLRLMELMLGYDYAIVIDAMLGGSAAEGEITCFPLEDLPDAYAGHVASPHNTNLQTALRLGSELNLPLPQKVVIVGIEAKRIYDFSEQLSTPIQAALPKAVQTVLGLIQTMQQTNS